MYIQKLDSASIFFHYCMLGSNKCQHFLVIYLQYPLDVVLEIGAPHNCFEILWRFLIHHLKKLTWNPPPKKMAPCNMLMFCWRGYFQIPWFLGLFHLDWRGNSLRQGTPKCRAPSKLQKDADTPPVTPFPAARGLEIGRLGCPCCKPPDGWKGHGKWSQSLHRIWLKEVRFLVRKQKPWQEYPVYHIREGCLVNTSSSKASACTVKHALNLTHLPLHLLITCFSISTWICYEGSQLFCVIPWLALPGNIFVT